MENKVSYTIVGFFVISLFVGIIMFVIWIARFDIDESNLKRYKIYVKDDSVSGLQKNSQVLFKGLDVGLVESININPKNIEQVEISIYITDYTMIKENSYALIQSLGITGNKYLEIAGGTNKAEVLDVPANGYGIIPLQKTFLAKITDNASDLFKKVDGIIEKIDSLMNKKTIDGIGNIVENVDTSTKHLIVEQKNVDKLIGSLNKLASDSNLKEVKETLNNAKESTNSFNELLKNDLKDLISEIKKSSNIDALKEKLNNTLEKLDKALNKVSDDSTNPIFTTREVTYGPGETKE